MAVVDINKNFLLDQLIGWLTVCDPSLTFMKERGFPGFTDFNQVKFVSCGQLLGSN